MYSADPEGRHDGRPLLPFSIVHSPGPEALSCQGGNEQCTVQLKKEMNTRPVGKGDRAGCPREKSLSPKRGAATWVPEVIMRPPFSERTPRRASWWEGAGEPLQTPWPLCGP